LTLAAFVLHGFTTLHAQEKGDTSAVLTMAEISPEYPGGDKAMYEFIGIHLEYPSEVANLGITGRVVVSFVVNADGGISEIKVVRGVHPDLDEEARRVLSGIPNWEPAEVQGRAISFRIYIPLEFR